MLDLDTPIESLRAHTYPTPEELAARAASLSGRLVQGDGITVSELARRRGITRTSVLDAERAGANVSLDVLRAYAEAAGWDVEVRLVRRT